MEKLREYRLEVLGLGAPDRPISILAATPTIALYQGAALALELDAIDFHMLPARPKLRH